MTGNNRQNFKALKKTLAVMLTCLFLTNNIAIASDGFSAIEPQKATLAPKLLFSDDVKQATLQARFLCEKIEKEARQEGILELEDVRKWLYESPELKRYQRVKFLEYNKEIYILADGKILIRYFNPENPGPEVLFPEQTDVNALVLKKSVTEGKLLRQVYKTSLNIPRDLKLEDILRHILGKAGLNDYIAIQGGFYDLPDNQYPVCALDYDDLLEDVRLIVHTEFDVDYEDIKNVGIGFPYQFDDGVTRWIDLADSVAYRAAMHEFNLEDREGLGHAFFNAGGKFDISEDEEEANKVGRRYSIVDDAMWLWYLHS